MQTQRREECGGGGARRALQGQVNQSETQERQREKQATKEKQQRANQEADEEDAGMEEACGKDGGVVWVCVYTSSEGHFVGFCSFC